MEGVTPRTVAASARPVLTAKFAPMDFQALEPKASAAFRATPVVVTLALRSPIS